MSGKRHGCRGTPRCHARGRVVSARQGLRLSAVFAIAGILAILAGCSSTDRPSREATAEAQVFATERAFAQSMARRDLAAFSSFVSEEAIFFNGAAPLRGKAEVVAWWSRYFEGDEAPFSWEPDAVEVLASGTLALSTGPVKDPTGKVIARFNSIWRRENPDVWRVVFDRGSPVCDDTGP